MAKSEIVKIEGTHHQIGFFWADPETGWLRVQPPVNFGEIVLTHAIEDTELGGIEQVTTSLPSADHVGGTLLQIHVEPHKRRPDSEELVRIGTEAATILLRYADATISDNAFLAVDS